MSKEQQPGRFRAGVLALIWWIATAVSGLLDIPAVWGLLIGQCPFRGQFRRARLVCLTKPEQDSRAAGIWRNTAPSRRALP
jgi:hypothetical protein